MKKVVLIYGLLSGVVVLPMIIMILLNKDHQGSMATSMIVGYTFMFLAFTMIFFGIRAYKKTRPNQRISFGRALVTGLLIAFIGSTIYVITWAGLSKTFYPDFADKYSEQTIKQWEADKTLSDEDVKKKKDELAKQMDFYKSWPGLIMFTYIEILPVGVLMSLIAAVVFGLFKRKPKDQEPIIQ